MALIKVYVSLKKGSSNAVKSCTHRRHIDEETDTCEKHTIWTIFKIFWRKNIYSYFKNDLKFCCIYTDNAGTKQNTRFSVRNSACPLVRDKCLFTRTSKQSVSSYPSDKWKFTTIFYFSLSFYYNAVIERQNAKDFTLENRQRSRCYLMSQK